MVKQISNLEHLVASDYPNVAGIVVMKNGEPQYESYFNDCTAGSPVHLFSVTSSIVSTLIGIAIDKGFIKSVDQKVLDFFPGYTPKKGEKAIYTVSLRNMLTMTAPFQYKSAPCDKLFASEDWVKTSLDLLGGREPDGKYRNISLVGPDILSGILVAATGQPLLRFAGEYLFDPLGITVEHNVIVDKTGPFSFLNGNPVSGWVADPKGINAAGWGLTLTATDMAKIGQLYLNGGSWNGEQIVSAEWISESTREHCRWEEAGLPFGYLWWPGIGDGYAAFGNSGNVIYINPKVQLVVAIASLRKSASDKIKLLMEHIEPMFAC